MNNHQASSLKHTWAFARRWDGVVRPYGPEDVVRLRGSYLIEHTLATMGAEGLWHLLHQEPWIGALGAVTGNQAVQQVRAGLQAIYVSGWQVAADANGAGHTYPDLSLYPADSVPHLVRRINLALRRADQIRSVEADKEISWLVPVVADAEAGFGGVLNAYEIMLALIEAGAAGVHFEDQLSALKKCGHMGGKVLVPAGDFIQKLVAARLASDVAGVPTILIARTDANGARLIQSDIDPLDRTFLTGERTAEGYFLLNGGLDLAITRALAYAPYADMIWCETSSPDLGEAQEFAKAVHAQFPGKLLAYNCSPSFNWRKKLDEKTISGFREELAELGYRFQFITLAGFHALNASMFELAHAYARTGMVAYSRLQQHEFELERSAGYEAVKHQRFAGAGYYDLIQMTVSRGQSTTVAMHHSTEDEQFR